MSCRQHKLACITRHPKGLGKVLIIIHLMCTSQVSQAQASGSGIQGAPSGGAPPLIPVSLPPGENHGRASGNPALDAVLLGVQQLQALQAQNLSGSKKADAPEQVKTGITAFPKLAAPNPAGGSLEFQDWLQLIAGSMGDFSDSSQLWWSSVSPDYTGCV